VACCCDYGDEPSGSGATELVLKDIQYEGVVKIRMAQDITYGIYKTGKIHDLLSNY
jgi:hypothetical protein